MTSVDYMHVKAVLTELLALSADARAARLEDLRVADRAVHDEVRSLLLHVDEPSERLDAVPDVRRVLNAAAARPDNLSDDEASRYVLDGPLESGARVGPFTLGERLGAGGMGVVYAAEQDEPRRAVALKFLAEGPSTRELRRRFRREVHVLGRLQHPGIAALYEAGTVRTPVGARPFFAMQRVGGVSLRSWLDEGRLVDEVIELVGQVCDAVAHAHAHGVIHRDLKPSNILVDKGRAVVVDFGIAKATETQTDLASLHTSTGQVIGTLSAMSPEQAAGDIHAVDARTDVYALGVILFEALTGQPPIDLVGLSVPAAALAIRERDARRLLDLRPDVPQHLDWIVDKALSKEPERRYADAQAFGDDLRRLAARELVAAKPLTSGQQLLRLARRHRVLTAAIIITFASLVVALVVSIESARSERAASDLAHREAARARIAAALAASDDSEPTSARRHLDAVPVQRREWEWYHLADRLAPFEVLTRDVIGVARLAFDPRAQRVCIAPKHGGLMEVTLDGALTRRGWPHDARVRALSEDASIAVVYREARLEVLDAVTGEVLAARASQEPRWVATDAHGTTVAWSTVDSLHRWDLASNSVAALEGRSPRPWEHGLITDDGLVVARTFKTIERVVIDGDELVSTGKSQVSQQRLPGIALVAGGGAAATREGRLVLFDPSTLDVRATLPGHRGEMTAVVASADGMHVVSAGVDNTLRLWETSSQRVVGTWSTGEHTLRSLALSSDGRRVFGSALGAVIAIDLARPAESDVLAGHTSYVYDVTIVDDRTAASVSWDQTLRHWDLDRAEALSVEPIIGRGAIVSNAPGGHQLALLAGRNVTVTSADSMDVIAKVSSDLRSLPWLDDRRVIVGSLRGGNSGRALAVIDASTGQVLSEFVTESRIRSLDVAGDNRVVLGASNGRVEVLDLESGEVSALGEHKASVVSVSVDNSGGRVLTTSEDGHARLWSLGEGRLLHDLPHGQEVWCGLWLPDDSRVVTGCHDGIVRLFDPIDGVLVASLRGHTRYVHALDVTRDGVAIVSASGDGALRVWRAPGSVSRQAARGR